MDINWLLFTQPDIPFPLALALSPAILSIIEAYYLLLLLRHQISHDVPDVSFGEYSTHRGHT